MTRKLRTWILPTGTVFVHFATERSTTWSITGVAFASDWSGDIQTLIDSRQDSLQNFYTTFRDAIAYHMADAITKVHSESFGDIELRTWTKDLKDIFKKMTPQEFANEFRKVMAGKDTAWDDWTTLSGAKIDIQDIAPNSTELKRINDNLSATLDNFTLQMRVLIEDIAEVNFDIADKWLDETSSMTKDMSELVNTFNKGGSAFFDVAQGVLSAILESGSFMPGGYLETMLEDALTQFIPKEGEYSLRDDAITSLEELAFVMDDLAKSYGEYAPELVALTSAIKIAAQDFTAAKIALEEDYYQKRSDTWTEVERYMLSTSGAASELEQALWGVNDQFDSWHDSLKDLGATTAELEKLENKRNVALKLTALLYQQEQMAGVSSGIEGLFDRLRGIIETQVTRDFTIEDWYRVIVRAGQKLELLDKDAFDDQQEYWDKVIELSTLQVDALENIISLTEQEISALQTVVDSISDLITQMTGGDLAPVQSIDFFDNTYEQLYSAAISGNATAQDIERYVAFIPDFLNAMKEFGYDYNAVVNVVMGDLQRVQEHANETLELMLDELFNISEYTGLTELGLEHIVGERLSTLIDVATTAAQIDAARGDLDVARTNATNSLLDIGFAGVIGMLTSGFQALLLASEASTQSIDDLIDEYINNNVDTGDYTPGGGNNSGSSGSNTGGASGGDGGPNDPYTPGGTNKDIAPSAFSMIKGMDTPAGYGYPPSSAPGYENIQPMAGESASNKNLWERRINQQFDQNAEFEDAFSAFSDKLGFSEDHLMSLLWNMAYSLDSSKDFSPSETADSIAHKILMSYENLGGGKQGVKNIYFYKKGGLAKNMGIVGEHGAEWVIPTYEPERTAFLSNINLDPQSIASEISSNINLQEGTGPIEITIEIGGEKFATAIVGAINKDARLRKTIKKAVK